MGEHIFTIIVVFAIAILVVIDLRFWRTGRRAKNRLKEECHSKPLYAINTCGDNIAVSLYQDYLNSRNEKTPTDMRPWEKQFVFPRRTFVYAKKDVRPIHIGNEESFKALTDAAIASYLKEMPHWITRRTKKYLEERIFCVTDDLFVPFGTELRNFGFAQQLQYFGRAKSELAKWYLRGGPDPQYW
jgi:hypothetical protein